MADLFLALGVICNSISVVLLQFQIRRLRREKENKLSVEDLKAANRLQRFAEEHFIAGDSVNPFQEVSGKYYGVHLED